MKPHPETWVYHDPHFAADEVDPEHRTGPWHGHRWFAYDLIRFGRPRTVVELGTHFGVSFFAMCQAVQDAGLETELHAVDTWQGDPDAGEYGPEVREVFDEVRARVYPDVAVTAHQCLFDEALPVFDDGSVEVLHIDGFHSYEAVRHDWETWAPKLAEGGVVLFHDIAPESGYGSARYWSELSAQHPSLTFPHSFGLGVLFPKGTGRYEVLFDGRSGPVVPFYVERAGHYLRRIQVEDLEALAVARYDIIEAQASAIRDRDEAIAAQGQMLEARWEVMEAQGQLVRERDALILEQTASIAARDQRIGQLEAELAAARAAAAELEQAHARSRARVDELSRPLDVSSARSAHGGVVRHPARAASRLILAAGRRLPPRTRRAVRSGVLVSRVASRRLPPPARRLARSAASTLARAGLPLPAPPHPDDVALGRAFDAEFYRATNPDIGRADPVGHYFGGGWRDGRRPHPLFDPAWYQERYPDVASMGMDPFAHYLLHGWREGRQADPLVDADWYAGTYGVTDRDPLTDLTQCGWAVGRPSSPALLRELLGPVTTVGDESPHAGFVLHRPDHDPLELPLGPLRTLDVDLVTVDIWDTLVVRTRPADAAKLATARRLFLRHNAVLDPSVQSPWDLLTRRVELEAEAPGGEAVLGAILGLLLAQTTTMGEQEVAAAAAVLAEEEIDDEAAHVAVVPELSSWLEDLHAERGASVTIALVSDFYIPAAGVRRILQAAGLRQDWLPVVVSCDEGCSKRVDGALFDLVRSRHGVPAGRHLHIGDNPWSDVGSQLATGGSAVAVSPRSGRWPGPGLLSPAGIDELLDQLVLDLEGVARSIGGDVWTSSPRAQRSFLAGVRSALFPVALVAAGVEAAVAGELPAVHYLSREGAFLREVHRAVASILTPAGSVVPTSRHLAVSRRSTFGPSLGQVDQDGLRLLWSMYDRQSPEALLVSLGADPAEFADAAARHRLPLGETVASMARDERVQGFLADRVVRSRLDDLLDERRRRTIAYLRSTADLAHERLVVVDVGWRGTIQDNLARLLPEHQLEGFYLGLFPFLNPQPANGRKTGVAFDANLGHPFAHAEPPAAVEAPWTPDLPSVIDYRLVDGDVVPVTEEESGVRAVEQIARFQEAVLAVAPTVARFLVANGLTAGSLRPALGRRLERYYQEPEGGVADIWFDSHHDDTFGVLNDTPFARPSPARRLLWEEGDPTTFPEAASTLWPQGWAAWLPNQAMAVVRARTGGGAAGAGGRA